MLIHFPLQTWLADGRRNRKVVFVPPKESESRSASERDRFHSLILSSGMPAASPLSSTTPQVLSLAPLRPDVRDVETVAL